LKNIFICLNDDKLKHIIGGASDQTTSTETFNIYYDKCTDTKTVTYYLVA